MLVTKLQKVTRVQKLQKTTTSVPKVIAETLKAVENLKFSNKIFVPVMVEIDFGIVYQIS